MKIEIIKDFEQKDFINEHMKLTKLQLRKSYVFALYMALIGISLIVYNTYISKSTIEWIDCGSPMVFFLFAVFILFQTRQMKQSTKLHLMSITRNKSGETTTKITDDGISYSDIEYSVKYNWSIFTHYRLIDNLISLTGPVEFDNGFIINKSDLDSASREELMDFLNKNLVLRKK